MLADDRERERWRVKAREGIEAWEYTVMAGEMKRVYRELVRG